MLAGSGLGAMILPVIAQAAITRRGWRTYSHFVRSCSMKNSRVVRTLLFTFIFVALPLWSQVAAGLSRAVND
jgi:hypothetical protein